MRKDVIDKEYRICFEKFRTTPTNLINLVKDFINSGCVDDHILSGDLK